MGSWDRKEFSDGRSVQSVPEGAKNTFIMGVEKRISTVFRVRMV